MPPLGPAIVWLKREEGQLPHGSTPDGYSVTLRATKSGVGFTVSDGLGSVTRYRESIGAAKRGAQLLIDDWRALTANPSTDRLLADA